VQQGAADAATVVDVFWTRFNITVQWNSTTCVCTDRLSAAYLRCAVRFTCHVPHV
jgi:hypothetical protein